MGDAIYTSRRGYWNWPEPIGSLVKSRHGARYGELILVGGQCAFDDNGKVLAEDPVTQAEIAMKYVNAIVEDLAGKSAHLSKLTVFYEYGGDEREVAILQRIRKSVKGDTPPALSIVPLPRLPLSDLKVIIDGVAISSDAGPAIASRPIEGHWPWPKDAQFSDGFRCGKWAFVSGQMSVDASGRTVHIGQIVDQAKVTINNLSNVLNALDCDIDDVVKLNTWYTGDGTDADWRKAAEVRVNAFRFPGPGATGVPVPGPYPRDLLLRQECMALYSDKETRLPRSLSWPAGHWNWPIPVTFQQALKVGPVVVLGGQIATDTKCKALFPGDMRRQTQNIVESIEHLLAGFEMPFRSVARLSCYYKTRGEMNDLTAMLEVLSRYLADPAPPITLIPLENLGFEGVTLEIEGLAFK